ncbi:4945_t:CDS:1, partial [Paraglomus occultum]
IEHEEDDLVYNVVDMETVIKAKFSDSHNPINFSLEVELDDGIYDTSLVDVTVNQDSGSVVAQEIAKHLQEQVEKGSEYYWEI